MIVTIGRPWMFLLILVTPVGLAGCTLIAKEVMTGIAHAANDPGPTATVRMVPLGPRSAVALAQAEQQTSADRSRCAEGARWRAVDRIGSQATRAKLATETYVVCMVGQGYRCADRSEHKTCAGAWGHPTATREQLLKDAGECRRAVFWILGLASTVHARYLECMTSKGYHADLGEPTGETNSPPSNEEHELIKEPPVR